jgi:hypothetical protein
MFIIKDEEYYFLINGVYVHECHLDWIGEFYAN